MEFLFTEAKGQEEQKMVKNIKIYILPLKYISIIYFTGIVYFKKQYIIKLQ